MSVNAWVIQYRDGRYAQIWYNQNYTVFGLSNNGGGWDPTDNVVQLVALGNGNVAFQCGGGYNAFASARYGDYGGQVQFQAPYSAQWITQVGGDETFQLVPTGDGYFAIYSPTYSSYVTINPNQDGSAQNCNPLTTQGPVTDVAQAARFSALGQNRPSVLDFVQLYQNASGLSFAGVNLASMDLSGCNLSHCDLSGVRGIGQCNLRGANLQGANLSGLSLIQVDISGADFSNANLSPVTCDVAPILAQANLTRAVLPAQVQGWNMQGATLAGVEMGGVNFSNADLAGADLQGADVGACVLVGANLSGTNLSSLDLRSARLTQANLTNTNLQGCDLAGLDLTGANLTGANFTGCNPVGLKLGGNVLTGTNFTGLDLTSVQFPSPLGQSTDSSAPTIFAQAKLSYSAIGLNWSCLDLTGTTILGMPTGLAGLNAAAAVLPGHSFEGCDLDSASFAQATLNSTDFTGAHLNKAVFDGALMTGAVFTRAKMEEATFVGAALGGVSEDQAAEFSFAYVSNCDFSQANMFGVSFAGATLTSDNKLSGSANLQETDFSNAYMANADLTGAVLQGAKFDGAFMVECILVNVDLSPTRDGSVPSSLTSACLQAANFQGANLSGANLSNAAITDVVGSIPVQYYDQTGNLTPSFPMPYPAGVFPAPSSLGAETVCPNGAPYATNQQNGLSLAQMMAATNPPTSWSPTNQAKEKAREPAGVGQ